MDRQDKLENLMQMAYTISKRSPDPRTKCGTVLTDMRGRVIGTGYNGFLRDTDGNFPLDRGASDSPEAKYPYICHSEMNAIHNCVVVPHYIGGAIAYVNGKCCFNCVREMWNFGVHTIFQGDIQPKMVNDNHRKITEKIIEKTGIKIYDVDCSNFKWLKGFYG